MSHHNNTQAQDVSGALLTSKDAPEPFSVSRPTAHTVPFVFNSPHSGRFYPPSFIKSSQLDNHTIRKSEDFLVDQLFSSVVQCGAPLVCGNYARAYLDINREPYELDADMFEDQLPEFANTTSVRVAGCLGTVARIVSDGYEIYHDKLNVADAIERVEAIYKPYHRLLDDMLQETRHKFGYAILVDCHSMPSAKRYRSPQMRADFVIGDRYGTSASAGIVTQAIETLRDLGYRVAANKPYAGGFITEHYGHPEDGCHALQIEINRSIYMDEKTMAPSKQFDDVCEDLAEFVKRLILFCGAAPGGQSVLAAE